MRILANASFSKKRKRKKNRKKKEEKKKKGKFSDMPALKHILTDPALGFSLAVYYTCFKFKILSIVCNLFETALEQNRVFVLLQQLYKITSLAVALNISTVA